MKILSNICCMFLLYFVNSISLAFAEEQLWFVKQQDLICLQNELGNYLQQEGDQFVIFISECPERDVVTILQKRTRNSSGQNLRTEENTPSSPAEVIIFTRKELECVANLQIEAGQKIIPIPKNPCQEAQ